jgi:hypothetical protein
MVSILILLRMLRIYRATLRARREGQPATFRQLWREDGGLMGFITGLGAENSGIGAGGIADLVRVRRMLEERARILEGLGKIPAMWEVQVKQKGMEGAGKADWDGGSLGADTPVQAYDVSEVLVASGTGARNSELGLDLRLRRTGPCSGGPARFGRSGALADESRPYSRYPSWLPLLRPMRTVRNLLNHYPSPNSLSPSSSLSLHRQSHESHSRPQHPQGPIPPPPIPNPSPSPTHSMTSPN